MGACSTPASSHQLAFLLAGSGSVISRPATAERECTSFHGRLQQQITAQEQSPLSLGILFRWWDMPHKLVEGKTLIGGSTVVDGTDFKNVVFQNVVLIYNGTAQTNFDHCKFINTTWQLDGNAAQTIEFLRGLYNSDFQPVVKQMMEYIAGNTAAGKVI